MKKLCAIVMLAGFALVATSTAFAQEGVTFETQEKVYNVVLIKVHPNMNEKYLNNLRKTWAVGAEEAKNAGAIEDYHVFTSLSYGSHDYNLMIMTVHENLASMDPTAEWRERVETIREAVRTKLSEEERDKVTETVYPEIRTFLSQQMLREVVFLGDE